MSLRFLNSQEEFERAIQGGRLSANPASLLYAGHFMYMGTRENGESLFKHSVTRQYLAAQHVIEPLNHGTGRA